MTVQPKAGELARYQLEDRYTQEKGRVFMTGTQALVRAVLDQARRDRTSGLNTAGFISGYRGSPLGALDLELWKAKDRLDAARIEFLPAVNEDLAATAVLGSQQVETNPKREVEGVFGLWYGKGPGVDRSGDALKHGNAYGSSPHGGVLVVAGDDHGCVSSSMPHQSDVAFMSWFMPTLNPASVSEYLAFAEYGYALSRFSGMWVGFKAISETVESAASVDIPAPRAFETPDFTPPPGGLHYRWPDLPGPQIEERMEAKKHAVLAFAEANPVDRHIYDVKDARFGIVTTGKAHLDLMEALRLLGIGEAACRKLGIDIYKVGMVWPLARRAALDFVKDKQEVLVIEEKRGIVESQFKEYFYDWPGHKPHAMVGKRDEDGERLVPWTGELSPRLLLPIVARRLEGIFPGSGFIARAEKILAAPAITLQVEGATRTPYFCSGCPHNTSTKVPEGSEALAGIGCHFMASWMDRNTTSLIQMGGEGVNWAASSLFTGKNHVFQNLGEGTWYHSGSMAVRQAIAAKANITFKILYNDAVAMTGGQPVDGPVSVQAIAHASRAEGVERIALVSDHPDKFQPGELPAATTIHHRRELDAVQRELREVKGVSILIYEQTCATEKRRRRKRGQMEDPKKFVVINDLVCEGCGDCSVESNCLSVEPLETEFGTKRKINQSSCNKDFSCVNGFCPSFVTVEGATRKKRSGMEFDLTRLAGDLPDPEPAALDRPFDLMITGVGGTGVVTVGALITMAAHLEGKGSSVLDFTGFAQKFGPVLSYVRLASAPDAIHQVRIDRGAADALIGCDIVVSSSPKASASYRPGMRAVVNLAEMPTGDIVRKRDASLDVDQRLAAIEGVTGKDALAAMDANRLSEKLMGDTVFANVMMLGFAWQKGLVPVSLNALTQAIVLNGVAIEKNHRAFLIGRLAAEKPDALKGLLDPKPQADGTLDEIVTRREAFLTDYQNAAYAARYRHLVDRVRAAEAPFGSDAVSRAVARSLFKLMAYKDEYEVARLHTQTGFSARIAEEFEGDYRIVHHLAPPFLASGTDARGRPLKREFGPWVRLPFRMLARMKRLRGTPFDPFGRTAERRIERELIGWYEAHVEKALAQLDTGNAATLAETLALPMQIRGYGPVKEEAAKRIRTEMAARL
ncbi:indolepyruvate ferredoxin oxidoreductase family protein [Nitratireductor aquimarinus]|uniref:indolepyruvate ferredoxin oxidoreductase family protein n=1 Tax=Nitratireductor aquimarinus TaxID=889300 RepID=UPI001A8CD9AC|nr:indolepyruvate ferredoxin oxidoreductase family protein [Nitratireductor aquimarinus]MBN8242426.1 indolepyruvate ferredoxin oxidoreductase family protein [Nitratireductor aquimarinus]MBY6130813.1 indolepyruvate ferredoxin oxidoreductase family protein [Nitratireductor aquimarinus]MCA1302431.1 indolepyruvate ferredoxin oxidoreductase family protein [Nitratireductor aquimarinus]